MFSLEKEIKIATDFNVHRFNKKEKAALMWR